MFCRLVESAVHAFANRDTWYRDDVFAPAVLMKQLKHSADVAVGFPSAGLHFHVQVNRSYRCGT